jgi:hypothetical protein
MSEESRDILKTNLEKNVNCFNESLEIEHIRKDGYPMWTYVNTKSLYARMASLLVVWVCLPILLREKSRN